MTLNQVPSADETFHWVCRCERQWLMSSAGIPGWQNVECEFALRCDNSEGEIAKPHAATRQLTSAPKRCTTLTASSICQITPRRRQGRCPIGQVAYRVVGRQLSQGIRDV